MYLILQCSFVFRRPTLLLGVPLLHFLYRTTPLFPTNLIGYGNIATENYRLCDRDKANDSCFYSLCRITSRRSWTRWRVDTRALACSSVSCRTSWVKCRWPATPTRPRSTPSWPSTSRWDSRGWGRSRAAPRRGLSKSVATLDAPPTSDSCVTAVSSVAVRRPDHGPLVLIQRSMPRPSHSLSLHFVILRDDFGVGIPYTHFLFSFKLSININVFVLSLLSC